jgi:hypothetical protein
MSFEVEIHYLQACDDVLKIREKPSVISHRVATVENECELNGVDVIPLEAGWLPFAPNHGKAAG